MGPNNNNKPKELTQEALNKKFSISFTRQQLTVIFNILHSREYRLPDARVVNSIIDLIEGPVVAVTNKDFVEEKPNKEATPPTDPKKEVVLN